MKSDQIIIKNLEVFANHGVYEAETTLGQKFVIDCVLHLHTRKAGQSDHLEDSVSYGDICRFIAREMNTENNKLLEKVAERITEKILLSFPLVRKLTFTVKKPWAPVKMHVDYTAVTIERGWHKIYIGLGSNMGDRNKYLSDALAKIEAHKWIRFVRTASIIETEPYGYVEQDNFLNTVCEAETLLDPEELLDFLHTVEAEANRTREIHWGPRTLDLDILLYDHLITEDKDLVLPHPEIEKRLFVLESLCELIPYGVHPLLNQRYRTLYDNLKAEQ